MDIHASLTAAIHCCDGTPEGRIAEALAPRVTDTHEDGSPAFTFRPWTDGHAIGFEITRHSDGAVSYVYLNPSQDTWCDSKFNPDAFVYTGAAGDPALDCPHHFYNIEFEA